MSLKPHFSRFLDSKPERLHFAAHSHHPWPDVTFEAHQRAWLDAATHIDDKWSVVFGEVIPEAQRHIAKELDLGDPSTITFAPNTHEFVLRLLSCLPDRPVIVTSDSEFHSFERQLRRLEEDQRVDVTRVPTEPFASLTERLADAVRRRPPHLLFVSQVFFNSGAELRGLEQLVSACPADLMIVIDGYHGFCAVPTSLRSLEERVFFLAGGYKYAMAGEGACFLHVPKGSSFRPRNTGWFAAFGALQEKQRGQVPYAPGGAAFMGATFDPSGVYRFNAVMRWREQLGLTTLQTRSTARLLQHRLISGLTARHPIREDQLVVPLADEARGQFLTFRTQDAKALCARLEGRHVSTDARDDRWRFGFGPYQEPADVDLLLERLVG